jgi:hypothetical protein
MMWLKGIAVQWKTLTALIGAATVGAAGASYFTLPRAVGNIAAEQAHQKQQLDDMNTIMDGLATAILANTKAIRLVSCTQSAALLPDAQTSRDAIHACIIAYGLPSDLEK